jgi:outer membrane protein
MNIAMTRLRLVAAVAAAACGWLAGPGHADTLEGALIQAYQNNPQLNAQRAVVRATDENVPQALSGYRPRITGTATVGSQHQDTMSKSTNIFGQPTYTDLGANFAPRTVGIATTQTLFNGYQTANTVRQAESQVSAAREALRLIEQQVLLAAATAYMDLLKNAALLDLQRRNVEVLQEQLRQTRDRFSVGEVTRTDVAQSESRLAAGRSSVLAAESAYATSRATYRQVIGVEAGRLMPASPVDRLSPRVLGQAIAQGRMEHPNVTTAMFNIDAQQFLVKLNEGKLYPTLTLNAQVNQAWETNSTTLLRQFNAFVQGQLSVPIYQGGGEYSTIRQAKETLGQRRIDLDTQRDATQALVVDSWGKLEAAKGQIQSTQAQVAAAEIALNGVREEARVGQRTTLDVLNAQQELVNARAALVTAQRDRVVASYTLLSAVGRLNVPTLGLNSSTYDPMVHYQQVRDSWFGVRTPDGR